ncbi:putative oxidoreductase [Clostridioides difficile]|nr:putative oxidoreductase [Clostridioides difficile]
MRATNFDEVCLGYNKEEAMAEANRCLACKKPKCVGAVSYTHLRAHETRHDLVCRLLLEKKKKTK